jgi:DNA-binding winged helix-turn-helix (wHTH) protein
MTCAAFSCDPLRRRLAATDGTVLHLTPKAFDLLLYLMTEAPRVVRKTELHAHLWPGTFVTDAALTSLVKELRRVLHRPNPGAALIKTAHGIGYAFEGTIRKAVLPATGGHWLVGPRGRVELQSGEHTIGRDPDSEVRLDEVDVSRRHARICIDGALATIEDLGSKNGTFVGTTRVLGRMPLRDGDIIRAAGACLTYRQPTRGSSTETVAHTPPA